MAETETKEEPKTVVEEEWPWGCCVVRRPKIEKPKHIKKEKNMEEIRKRKKERREMAKNRVGEEQKQAREKAIQYLHTWKENRDQWRFKSNCQVGEVLNDEV